MGGDEELPVELFPCLQCDRVFSRRKSLNLHKNVHSERFKCKECGSCKESKAHLMLHMQSHKPWLICKMCSQKFKNQLDYHKHVLKHSNVVTKGEIEFHANGFLLGRRSNTMFFFNKSGRNYFACSQCPKVFRSPSGLVGHRNIHLEKYKCPDCGLCCAFQTDIDRHLRTRHDFICPFCDNCFTNIKMLKNHSYFVHGLGNSRTIYRCTLCFKILKTPHGLKSHMNLHLQTYKCQTCGSCFSFEMELKRHLTLKHYFQCHLCNLCFVAEGFLKRHLHRDH
uniref:C2H2-type domain-containing protein n=1 Tax=Strigamia maritima TaxID=126957 RepID=T1IP23_STRMM